MLPALALAAALAVLPAAAALAQFGGGAGGPRELFPGLPPGPGPAAPTPAFPPTEEAPPQAPTAERVETPPVVEVVPLPPPGLGARGLPGAERALGGPLWAGAAPGDLAARIARLPARVEDQTLRRLQRDLLLAPGPVGGADGDTVRARVGRLLAMGEAPAATELLATLPATPAGEELDDLRAQALLAADQVEPGCAVVDQAAGDGGIWPEARLVCAALRGDAARVDLGLSLQAERGRPADPLLASLVRGLVAGGGQRVTVREPPPPDPLLLPLLRRVPLQLEAKALPASTPPAVRQAIAQNPGVPAGMAPPAASVPVRPAYPGLDGRAPADWRKALQAVPAPLRPRWLAALDGLGAGPPDAALADLPAAATVASGGRVDLGAWRGLERARAEGGGGRGEALLELLRLLDGRPAEAAPLALRAAVAALRGLGLEADARAVAAAGLAG